MGFVSVGHDSDGRTEDPIVCVNGWLYSESRIDVPLDFPGQRPGRPIFIPGVK